MSLPTQKELAEDLIAQQRKYAFWRCGHEPNATCSSCKEAWVKVADALLARLRPARDKLEQRAQDWGVMFDKSREHASALMAERDALRADLRACAEALAMSQEDLHHTLDHKTHECQRCAVNAALARSGVREALR